MSFRQSQLLRAGSTQTRPASERMLGVYDICHQHIRELSGLPGELSQFLENGIGYEWRCQMNLGHCASGHVLTNTPCALQLQFSLMDLQGRSRPVAVLYLIEQERDSERHERVLLPMAGSGDTHDRLTVHLLPLGVSIEFMEKADQFLHALDLVREVLGARVTWI